MVGSFACRLRALSVFLACPDAAFGSLEGGVGVALGEKAARFTDGREFGRCLVVGYETVIVKTCGGFRHHGEFERVECFG